MRLNPDYAIPNSSRTRDSRRDPRYRAIRNPTDRGAILLKAVLVLSLLVVAGILSILAVTTMRYQSADRRAAALQARLWAESGIQDAINRIRHDPFWRAAGNDSSPALVKSFEDEGEYEVLATTSIPPNHVTIKAIGRASWSNREVRQDLILDIPTLFALIATENVRLSGNATVDGAISAGENVIVSGDAAITGPVQVRANFNGPTRVASAPIYEGFRALVRPSFDLEPYVSSGGLRLFGGALSNLTASDTEIHIVGSTEITGVTLTNGTLIVVGDLRVTGPCRIESASGRMAIVVTGNLTVEGRGSLIVQGPVYVARDFRSRGRTMVEGTIMAAYIELGSESRVRPRLEAVYAAILGLSRTIERGRYIESPL